MGTTTDYGLRWPDPGLPAAISLYLQQLAEDVENTLKNRYKPQSLAAGANLGAGSMPANTDYGVGTFAVTEGAVLSVPGVDTLRFTQAGLVVVTARFYMPNTVERAGWIGIPGTTKASMNGWATGVGADKDRFSVTWSGRVTAGFDMSFGMRSAAVLSGTTCTVTGTWTPLP